MFFKKCLNQCFWFFDLNSYSIYGYGFNPSSLVCTKTFCKKGTHCPVLWLNSHKGVIRTAISDACPALCADTAVTETLSSAPPIGRNSDADLLGWGRRTYSESLWFLDATVPLLRMVFPVKVSEFSTQETITFSNLHFFTKQENFEKHRLERSIDKEFELL